jgi:outer membrane protein OmpA-like peptidoglycan-associated protein
MNKAWIALSALTLAACTGEPRYYAPPPEPMQPYAQRPYAEKPMPPRPGPYAPPPVASAGPLKMAQVSAYMDAQENELRARLRGQGVIVARRGDEIVLNIPNAALFESGADLSGAGADILQTLAMTERHYDHTALQVNGYTDTTGAPDKNLDISQRRAHAVAGALASYGVPGNRIAAQGFGETNPRIKTGENVNEPRNRRIEIHITATPTG